MIYRKRQSPKSTKALPPSAPPPLWWRTTPPHHQVSGCAVGGRLKCVKTMLQSILDFQAALQQRSVLVQLILEAICCLQRRNKPFTQRFERRRRRSWTWAWTWICHVLLPAPRWRANTCCLLSVCFALASFSADFPTFDL